MATPDSRPRLTSRQVRDITAAGLMTGAVITLVIVAFTLGPRLGAATTAVVAGIVGVFLGLDRG